MKHNKSKPDFVKMFKESRLFKAKEAKPEQPKTRLSEDGSMVLIGEGVEYNGVKYYPGYPNKQPEAESQEELVRAFLQLFWELQSHDEGGDYVNTCLRNEFTITRNKH
jgi:hypothetical protein